MAVRRRRGLSFDILGQDKTGRAFAQVNRRLKTLGAGAARAGKALAAVGTAAAAGLAVLAKKSLDAADNIAKVADKVGISTDALQEYRIAADLADVSQSALDMGLQRFSRRLGEAAKGQGVLKDVLAEYGIAVRDAEGNTRSLEDVLGDYADAIGNAESEQEKLRLAFKAFDSEGAALVNVLRDGQAAVDKTREKIRRLGLVIEEDLLRQAEGAKDALTILTKVISTRLTVAIIKAAPTIERFALGLVKVIEKIDEFFKAPEINRLQAEIEVLDADLLELEKTAARVALGLQAPVMGLDELIARTQQRLGGLREELARLRGEIEKTPGAAAAGGALGGGGGEAGGARPPIPDRKPIEEITKALEAETKALEAEKDVVEEKTAKTGELIDMEGRLKDITVDIADRAIQGQITSWQDLGQVALSVLQDMIAQVLQLNSALGAGGGGPGGLLAGLAGLFGAGGGGGGGGGFADLPFVPMQRGGRVRAAAGGPPDSKLAMFAVSPREELEFTPAGRTRRGGSGQVINFGPIDMRGASAEAVARLELLVARVNGSIERRAVAAVYDSRVRG